MFKAFVNPAVCRFPTHQQLNVERATELLAKDRSVQLVERTGHAFIIPRELIHAA